MQSTIPQFPTFCASMLKYSTEVRERGGRVNMAKYVLTTTVFCDTLLPREWRYMLMGAHPTGERKYQIEHMWNVHHEILRLSLTGMKGVDIARQLNISEATVSTTLNSEIAKRKMARLQGARDMDAVSVSKKIQELAPKAVEVLDKLLDSQVEAIKFRTAADVLDRAGHGAVKKELNISGHLSKEDIDEIKNRAKEIGLVRSLSPSTA